MLAQANSNAISMTKALLWEKNVDCLYLNQIYIKLDIFRCLSFVTGLVSDCKLAPLTAIFSLGGEEALDVIEHLAERHQQFHNKKALRFFGSVFK